MLDQFSTYKYSMVLLTLMKQIFFISAGGLRSLQILVKFSHHAFVIVSLYECITLIV